MHPTGGTYFSPAAPGPYWAWFRTPACTNRRFSVLHPPAYFFPFTAFKLFYHIATTFVNSISIKKLPSADGSFLGLFKCKNSCDNCGNLCSCCGNLRIPCTFCVAFHKSAARRILNCRNCIFGDFIKIFV